VARIEYTPRHLGRTYLERDRDNALRLGVYFGSGVVTPTSGTFSLYNSANVLVVDAAAVGMDASGFATGTVSAATLTSSALGSGWRVEWDLLMPDTYHHVYRNAASLCRVRLPPAATEETWQALFPTRKGGGTITMPALNISGDTGLWILGGLAVGSALWIWIRLRSGRFSPSPAMAGLSRRRRARR